MKGLKRVLTGRTAFGAVLIALTAAVAVSVVTAVCIGSASISAGDILGVVRYKIFGIGDAERFGAGPVSDIIWFIRLPRLLLAVAVGMGLAVSGVIMQAIVKNPLADPYVLGISSGASMGATLAILAGIGHTLGTGFVGVMGCLAGAKWEVLHVLLPFVTLCSLFLWSQSRTLDMMLLGDEVSVTLGTDLHKYRMLYLLVSSAMIGLIVYSSGIIGFVGLIVPHVVRMSFGVRHKRLLPVSALLGAVLLIWSDVLCRVIIPRSELPIGILTSMIGAPCFVYLMARKKYGFGGER